MKNWWLAISLALAPVTFFSISALAQETTGGLQGTVKDPTGGCGTRCQKGGVTGSALARRQRSRYDGSGYDRFAQSSARLLPPYGNYQGFKTFKR